MNHILRIHLKLCHILSSHNYKLTHSIFCWKFLTLSVIDFQTSDTFSKVSESTIIFSFVNCGRRLWAFSTSAPSAYRQYEVINFPTTRHMIYSTENFVEPMLTWELLGINALEWLGNGWKCLYLRRLWCP